MRNPLRSLFGVVLFLVLSMLPMAGPGLITPHAQEYRATVYLFWQQGCPYCANAKSELQAMAAANRLMELRAIEVGSSSEANALFERTLTLFGYDQASVPLVIVGERPFLGFSSDGKSVSEYRQAIEQCVRTNCPDIVGALAKAGAEDGVVVTSEKPSVEGASPPKVPDIIQIPVFGELKTSDLSLAALTVVLAAIDGFNPCAMWVLVFLIGLLLGLKDEKRMWILGGAFLGATAIMYFAVIAAWLNLVLFLGAIVWLRITIGLLALAAGIYFLREYWTKPESACRVTSPGRRRKLMDRFRSVVTDGRLILSVIGIMGLAVAVNLIELLCSAGIPAVFVQVLALNDLSPATYYAYLGLYIAIFMLDDVVIFATAMIALRVTGLTGSYARVSHLIGGFVLLAIGAILLLRPELLSFS